MTVSRTSITVRKRHHEEPCFERPGGYGGVTLKYLSRYGKSILTFISYSRGTTTKTALALGFSYRTLVHFRQHDRLWRFGLRNSTQSHSTS